MPQYKFCDNIYTNGDPKNSKDVTYHIKAGDATVIIEGGAEGDYQLDPNKEQDHTFTVPPGGKLHVKGGEPTVTASVGQVSSAATTVMRSQELQGFATELLKLSQISKLVESLQSTGSVSLTGLG